MARKMSKIQLPPKDLTKAALPVKMKKPRKRRTLEQKTAQQLVKVADKWFSKYIRIRDAEYVNGEWVGNCITSGKKLIVIDSDGKWIASSQNGHFISRGVYSLRFDECNCNLQSAYDNAWRDKESMQEAYREGLALKYGEATVQELKQLSKAPGAFKRPTKPELLEIISDSKAQIAFYLKNN